MNYRRTLDASSLESAGSWFERTHWSVVLAAGRGNESDRSAALETLCRTYWQPVHAFLRSRGLNPQDAEDITQGFFAHLLERNRLRGVGPELGRFRSFLLTAVKNYLDDSLDHQRAVKRGGGRVFISLSENSSESQLDRTMVAAQPEAVFDRRWAATVLSQAFAALQAKFAAEGNESQLHELAVFLGKPGSAEDYDAAASALGTTRGAVAVAVHRLRQCYGDLVRREIAETVDTTAELNEEMRYLLEIACS